MNQPDHPHRAPSTSETKSAKKPYQKPEVRHERVFETMALSCGKVQTTSHACRVSRKNS